MTEAEWETTTDYRSMINRIQSAGISFRQALLFRAACCRQHWKLLTITQARRAVEAAEEFVENCKSAEEVKAIYWKGVGRYMKYLSDKNVRNSSNGDVALARRLFLSGYAIDSADGDGELEKLPLFPEEPSFYDGFLDHTILHFLRDIFGNPFRPVAVDPAWLTDTAVSLARGIYDDRAFDRLPILADALQDAGCENADILGHCRGDGPHVRGCWVVDLVLGKN